MNSFWKGVLINVGIVYGLAVLTLSTGEASGFLIVPILIAVFEFFLSLLLLIFTRTRRAGQIMVAASGIIFLIGLGVCTVVPFKMDMR
jgi:hypothetical protein